MLKFIKSCLISKHGLFVRYSSSRRYQFRVEKQIYYPKRVLSKKDELETPLLMQNNDHISILPFFNYYKTLGVPKKASTQQIKTAYYNLAKMFHPDVKPTPQETKSFQEISEAYRVLCDEHKRRKYDQFGYVKFVQENATKLAENRKIVEKKSLCKTFKKEGTVCKTDTNKTSKTLLDISPEISSNEIQIELKFLQSIHGTRQYIDLKGIAKCPKCYGANIECCPHCGAIVEYLDKSEKYLVTTKCQYCNGNLYLKNLVCRTCANKGVIVESRSVEIIIPPSTSSGDIIKITNPLNKQIVNIRINVIESNYFKVDGVNINTDKYLTISQAVLGGKFKIHGLYKDFYVNLSPGVESHITHRFKGKGVKTHSSFAGDHIVTFKVLIPKILTTKQRQLMVALSKAEDPAL